MKYYYKSWFSLFLTRSTLSHTCLAFVVAPTASSQVQFDLQSQSLQSNDETSTCDAPSNMTKFRSVRKILPKTTPHWVGDGFRVYPVFSNSAFTEELSPLLMFDYAEPKRFPAKVGPPLGVGRHPHKGFETVTVAFQGQVEHKDSTGKSGVIAAGDVQWMTAGRGIVHQEYHSEQFTKEGGVFEMCQLWVNLPKKHKMTKPGYQAIAKKDIPVVSLPLGASANDETLGYARIIAGELGDTPGAAKTFSPVQMWDVSLPKKGTEVELPFPADHNCMVFVRRGAVQVVSSDSENNNDNKATDLGPQNVVLLRMDGSSTIKLRVQQDDSSVLILGGEPLNEPIAAHGPFVMNDHKEIDQAISDYRMGKFGS